MEKPNMKIMCVHAHFDDLEFYGAGTFELFHQKYSDQLQALSLVCTDGRAGHQFRTRDETAKIRKKEQQEAAEIGGYQTEVLTLPDGSHPREGCLILDTDFMAALWHSIRRFQPDYLFCPPLTNHPLAGLHIDHEAVANAVRNIAYMINVPHAFTPEYPTDETQSESIKIPVILNFFDRYQKSLNTPHDIAFNIEPVFDIPLHTTYTHQSQIQEWLPWVDPDDFSAPQNLAEWKDILKNFYHANSRKMGIIPERILEAFTVTAWGTIPSYEQLIEDFPSMDTEASHLGNLQERLSQWKS